MTVTVLSPGFLTTVQDDGRARLRSSGISPGGALDAHALRVANLLVGNDTSAAGLEITFGGLRVSFEDTRLIAWCGGRFDARVGEAPLAAGRPAIIRAGELLTIDRPEIGCRAWLAISGGIDVPRVLGSRSTDLRAQFGGFDGRALQADDVLPLGTPPARSAQTMLALERHARAPWLASATWASPAKREPVLRVMRGGEWLRFDPDVRTVLLREPYSVTAQADRMGVRLEGALLRYDGPELLSEAVAAGAVQVPPSGHPIVLLPDCQTIGGYPKLAHVITVDLAVAAQLRAGDQVRFELVRLAEAHQLLLERERELALFRTALTMRMR